MRKLQQGFALIIVIWILMLLSLMAGGFAKTMRRDSSVTEAVRNNAQAMALAESGYGLALYMLQQPNPDLRWLANGVKYRILRQDGGEMRIKLVSEAGKVDINAAEDETLSSVINAVTGDFWRRQQLLDCILDWRDEDDEPRPQGAEKKQYQDAGLPYSPSNKPFQSLEELRMVLGVDEDVYSRLQPFITIYSGRGKVNLDEAPPELLQILNADLAGQNMQNTPAPSGQPGGAPQNSLNSDNLGTGNNDIRTYTIIIDARMVDGSSASLEAVVRIQPGNSTQGAVLVLDWKQNQLMRSLFVNDMDSRIITVQNEFTNDN